jgi:hypothetical protein
MANIDGQSVDHRPREADDHIWALDDHFREQDWVDFARRRGDPEHRARVAQHLESGCPECERTLRLWAAVLSVADQEKTWGTDAAVRPVKSRLSQERPKGIRERMAAHISLVFDGFVGPQLAGVRSSGVLPRQLLYKAGRYTIKLQVETGAASERMSIIGQILDEQDPSGVLSDIAVRALKGNRTLDRTLTNGLGEFYLEPGATDTIQLSVNVTEIGTFTVQARRGMERTGRRGHKRAIDGSGRAKKARPR